MLLATDVFGTKPLFYSREAGALGCSTYMSGLKRSASSESRMKNKNYTEEGEMFSAEIDVQQLEPNTWILLSLDETEKIKNPSGGEIHIHRELERGSLREFDLRQHKDSVDDFIEAFER